MSRLGDMLAQWARRIPAPAPVTPATPPAPVTLATPPAPVSTIHPLASTNFSRTARQGAPLT